MKPIRFVAAWSFALAFGSLSAPALADVVTGSLWRVPDDVAQNAVPANVPDRAADVTFDVNAPLDFDSPGSVQSFLDSGGAFNIAEHTAGTLVAPMSDGVTSTLITFSGLVTVTSGQQFTVAHDDGLTLVIGGINLDFSSGPTPPTTSIATYDGPSGTFAFQLVYGECCSGSAVLQIDLPFANAVPEPGTMAMLAGGLGALALRRRRPARA